VSDQKNVVTYELDVQAGAAQMAIAQTLQSARGSMAAGLAEPVNAFLGATSTAVGQQHVLSSQRLTAGWANLQTAAAEYTQRSFYQNVAFGTKPSTASDEMALQRMAAGMPFHGGVPLNASEMRHFSASVMAPFEGLIGFQEPYAATLASAASADLARVAGTPSRLAEAATQLGAITAGINKAYGVGGEGGAYYTQMLAAGVPIDRAQGTYEAAIRADAAGVPLGQSLASVQQYQSTVSARETLGIGNGPGGGLDYSAADVVKQSIDAERIGRQFRDQGYSWNASDSARYISTVQSLNELNHGSDEALLSNQKTALWQTKGAAASVANMDFVRADQRGDDALQAIQEQRSAEYSGKQDMLDHIRSTPGFLGTIGRAMVDRFSPGASERIGALMGYSPESPSRDKNGNVIVTPRALDMMAGGSAALAQMGSFGEMGAALGSARTSREKGDLSGGSDTLMKAVAGKNFPEDIKNRIMKDINTQGGKNSFQQMVDVAGDPTKWGAAWSSKSAGLQVNTESILRAGVEEAQSRLIGSATAGGLQERDAWKRAGTDVYGSDALNRIGTRIEGEVLAGRDVKSAMKEFNLASRGDAGFMNTMRLHAEEIRGGKAGAREEGLRDARTIESYRVMTGIPDLMAHFIPGAIGLMQDKKEDAALVGKLRELQAAGGSNEEQMSGVGNIVRGATKEQQQRLATYMTHTINDMRPVSAGTPDFGNFQKALTTAATALEAVSKVIPGANANTENR
jgi:hypothetical protein